MFLTELKCKECKRSYQDDPCNGHLCPKCKTKLKALERKKHFEFLDSLPIEARLRKVEEWIYDYKPVHVQPPTFG